MKKSRRITQSREFRQLIHKADKKASAALALYYRPKVKERGRIGISVSKKNGNAVTRNRIKRQIRMMCLETGALEKDLDMIILARRDYDPGDYAGMKKQLESLLKHATIKRS